MGSVTNKVPKSVQRAAFDIIQAGLASGRNVDGGFFIQLDGLLVDDIDYGSWRFEIRRTAKP